MKKLLGHTKSLLQYHGRRESFRGDTHPISVQIKAGGGRPSTGTHRGDACRPLKRHRDERCPPTALKEALHTPFCKSAHGAQSPSTPRDQNWTCLDLVLFIHGQFNWVTKVGFSKQNLKARFPIQKDGADARKHMAGNEMR